MSESWVLLLNVCCRFQFWMFSKLSGKFTIYVTLSCSGSWWPNYPCQNLPKLYSVTRWMFVWFSPALNIGAPFSASALLFITIAYWYDVSLRVVVHACLTSHCHCLPAWRHSDYSNDDVISIKASANQHYVQNLTQFQQVSAQPSLGTSRLCLAQ